MLGWESFLLAQRGLELGTYRFLLEVTCKWRNSYFIFFIERSCIPFPQPPPAIPKLNKKKRQFVLAFHNGSRMSHWPCWELLAGVMSRGCAGPEAVLVPRPEAMVVGHRAPAPGSALSAGHGPDPPPGACCMS